MQIEQLGPDDALSLLPELVALLVDAVENGASIGFVPPFSPAEAEEYWQGVVAKLRTPHQRLFIARTDNQIIGSVQLALEPRPNGNHRGEVNKLLVHTAARRRGVALALMQALEAEARRIGRTLLVLDTRVGDDAERLYLKLGFLRAGSIPNYARNGDGGLDPTMFMYKILAA